MAAFCLRRLYSSQTCKRTGTWFVQHRASLSQRTGTKLDNPIGCTCSGGGKETYPTAASLNCPNPGTPTLTKASDLTWNVDKASPMGEWNKYMPWRAPGTSKPLDSCGIASGFFALCVRAVPTHVQRHKHHSRDERDHAEARAHCVLGAGARGGSVVSSARQPRGGYQYRVCPSKSASMDEACFEANPLQFASANHVVVMDGKSINVPAHDVTSGVRPANHSWRKLPLPACNCDLGASCSLSSSKGANDTVAYSNETKYGSCDHGLQFEAPHLRDGTWPEGFGYYVDSLGPPGPRPEKNSEKKTSGCYSKTAQASCTADNACGWTTKSGKSYCAPICESLADQTACGANSKCQWYSGKGVCGNAPDACGVLASKATCEAQSGCAWYTPKSTCYTPQAVDKDAGFGGSKGSEDQQKSGYTRNWEIVDKVVAPSTPGDYVLQWRWDNEQTPQIWTSCADIKVCKGCEPVPLSSACTRASLPGLLLAAFLSLAFCL